MAGPLEAVVLDYDGLILDTESVEYQSLAELYAEHGLELPFEEWRRTVGSVSVDWVALLQARAGRRLDEAAARRGLLDRLDAVVTRDDVTATKPAPEPYLRALDALAATPERSVAFEDSAHGVAAATAAGMRCVAVPSTRGQDFSRATLVTERVDQIDLDALLRGHLDVLAR